MKQSKQQVKAIVVGVMAFAGVRGAAMADGLDTLRYAISGGTPSLDARARWEEVDQGSQTPQKRTADAYTLRARLGYTTGKWNDFDAQAEYESVAVFGGEEYNSTLNGKPSYSTIADPQGTELNQAWLRYSGLPFSTTAKVGRQRIILDNHRFIGNAGWRQNEMTYDAANISNTFLPKTTFDYYWISNVDRFDTTNIPMRGNTVHIANTAYAWANVTAYGHWFDFKTNTAARQDTQTLGLRVTGSGTLAGFKPLYTLEYARQSHYADAPSFVGADYWLAEVGNTFAPFSVFKSTTIKLGFEVLGGDGKYGFQTPLASLFAFQGWADQFLNTPATGIQDTYVNAGTTVEKVSLMAIWHDYEAVHGGAHYGSEWDFHVSRPIVENFTAGVRYADYDSKGFSVDTRKLWVFAEYKF